MKLRLLIFILLGYAACLNAQNNNCEYVLTGKVLDVETNQPIPYAVVKVQGTDKYTSSNIEGDFRIEGLCTTKNTLRISCVGYAESTEAHDHDSEIHFYLTQEVTGLENVTIQAERIKEKGTESIAQLTLGKADISSTPTQSLASVLAQQQGLSFISNGNNAELPVLHGLYGNRILLLNNGLKHGFQNWGTDHAPEIDIAAANRITVVKGAAGVRYGPEALGGAIIIESEPLVLNNPFFANLGTGYQSNGRGYHANIQVGGGSNNWGYYANGGYTKIGDRNTPDYNLTNSGKEEKSFGFGLLRHLEKWDFNLSYSFIDQNLAFLRSSIASSPESFIRAINAEEPIIINPFSYDIDQPNQTSEHHLAKAEINWWYKEGARISLIGGIQFNRRDEFDVRRNSELPIIDLDLLTYDYQLECKHAKWKGLDGLFGAQYFSQNNDNNPGTQTTPFIPNYNTDRYSIFGIESLDFGKNSLELGVRFDFETNNVRGRETNQDIFRDEYSFGNVTASLGYVRKISESATFRSNIGTAWRNPNMAELFSFGQHGFKNTFGLLRFIDNNGNLSTSEVVPFEQSGVDAEKGYKFINELQIRKNGNAHSLTAYTHLIENYIFERPIGVFGTIRGPMPAFIYDQTNAFFIGADYTFRKEWSRKFNSNFGFSYLWSRNISDNETLINQPPISVSLDWQWVHDKFWFFDDSRLSIRSSYTFEQFQAPRTLTPEDLVNGSVELTTESEIFDFIDAPDGFFLMNVAWNFKWKKLSGSISFQNLFNARYRNYLNEMRYFADEPGRNILVNLNYSITGK